MRSDNRESELRKRFAKYESELSVANRKIEDRTFLSGCTDTIVTVIASASGKSVASNESQTRIEQLLQQLTALENEKRKLVQEKDDLQKQLISQKDRIVEVEREAGYVCSPSSLIIADLNRH
jgi:chromosome segregation ATPase